MNVVSLDAGSSAFPGMLGFFGSAVVGILIIAAWVILAGSRFVQGGVVERPERVPQLYGYTVCLVSLFWAIASLVTVVGAALTLSAPTHLGEGQYPFMPSVTSFEAFRTTYEQSRRMMGPDPREKPDSLDEAELRRRYAAIRADRIERNTIEAQRAIVTSVISLLIAAALFAFHWRWLQRVAGAAPPGEANRIDI